MHQPNRRRALVAAVLATSAPAIAATVDWLPTAPNPAPFSDPANWSSGAAPTSADVARFSTGTAHTVVLTTDVTTDQLLVADDNLTLDLAGRTYTLANTTSAAPSLFLGSSAGSSLTLVNSASATPGLLNISYATLAAAASDRADLTLAAGTSLNATGIEFRAAAYGTASLTVSPASTLTTRSTYFAAQPGSSASVSLAGPGARWNAYIVQLAFSGSADLSISDGASAGASGQLVMAAGRGGTASATVNGQGSTLTAGSISVGQLGTASLVVRDGATVSTTYDIGIGRGTATVDGPSSAVSAGSYLYVGGYFGPAGATAGSATLNVRGGSVSSVGPLKLWNTQGTALNLSGGALKIPYADPTSDLSRFHWTGGTLELTSSAFQVSNPTTVSPALNYIFNAGPTVSLTAGMTLKVSSQPNSTHYLVVDNGGTLSAENASISVGDAAIVGYAATGTLALTNHASMSSLGGTIGYYGWVNGTVQRGTGYVTLDDHASWTLTGDLITGGDGGGTLAVRGDSSVSNSNATLAAGPIASSATVEGPGSSWSSSGTLTVGKLGQGTLTISNGGAVSSATAIIASSLVATGSTVAVRGAGSSWTNANTLSVAGGQTSNTSRTPASLSVSDHAAVTTRTLAVGTNSTSATGSVTLTADATLSVATSAYLGGITTPRGTATLSLTDSSATIGNTLKLHNTPNTSLSLTRSTLTIGTPAAPGSLDNAASIALADHSTLTLYGSLANAGTLTLSHDSLLLWDLTAAPDPLATLRSQFATGHIVAPASDVTHRPAYTFSGEPTAPTSLTVQLALIGDTNLDGRLDVDDYALLDRAFARAATNAVWTDGDFDYDGIVTNQDYLLIDAAYAQSHPLGPSFLAARESQFGAEYVSQLLTSIPEPSSLACLFAGSLLLARRRHR